MVWGVGMVRRRWREVMTSLPSSVAMRRSRGRRVGRVSPSFRVVDVVVLAAYTAHSNLQKHIFDDGYL